jgi:transcriptional regulator with PAS, ATPase and Fis domain
MPKGAGLNEPIKGGNSRQLGRTLDQLDQPIAIIDRRGTVVYANAALCTMADLSAAELVGQTCHWQIAADDRCSLILTAMAPPTGALEGHVVHRQLTAPVVFGSNHTGQLFVPVLDQQGQVHCTLIYLGNSDHLRQSLQTQTTASGSRRDPQQLLMQIRSRWKNLDGLLSLVGSSPAIELAMQRSQLAIKQSCNVFIFGAAGTGKLELAHGVFLGRLKALGLPATGGHCFPVDCRLLDVELLGSMLEIFADRLPADSASAACQLILTGVDRLSSASLPQLVDWLNNMHGRCTVIATSSLSAAELSKREAIWAELVGRLATIEIQLPPLSQRRADIVPLAHQALAESCKKADRAQLTLSPDVLDLLESYSWPGNTRQIRSAMQEATQMAVLTASIQPQHLPVAIRTFAGAASAGQAATVEPIQLDSVLLEVEKTIIRRALKQSPRNRAQAARLLGISRAKLLRRIEQLGLGDAIPVDSDEDSDPQEDG